MRVPVDFSLVVDIALERRRKIERTVELEHADSKKFAEKQTCEQETVYHRGGLSKRHRC